MLKKNKKPQDLFIIYQKPILSKQCRLKIKGQKRKLQHADTDQKKAGIATLTSDKINIRARTFTSDKGGHYRRSTRNEDIVILNGHVPNNKYLNCEANTARTEKRDVESTYYQRWRLQHLLLLQ